MGSSKLSNRNVFCYVLSLWLFHGGRGLAMAASDTTSRALDQTPTWAVAAVCTVFILISITLEKSLHKFGTWLAKRGKKPLLEALQKIKDELMILGFLSLLLTFGQSFIVKICIPVRVANKMLPCPHIYVGNVTGIEEEEEEEHGRKLLSYERRYLAADSSTWYKCSTEGHEPLLSVNGLHQLHILIFFLAVFHVLYSAITMLLGRLKILGWKTWEEETSTHGYEFAYDAARFRLTHQTSFVRAHTSFWTRNSIFFYIGCFFRQFYRSVRKVDYQTLRNGFISAHLTPGTKFNFQKYIKRSLEDDFKVVVGISPVLWASAVVFLLLNINGWRTPLWGFLIPNIMILAVGTKLQAILANMALEITERHEVVQGMPLVQGSDRYFWFGQPHFVLNLIHFALFQNSFQIIYILWAWYCFGLDNCFRLDYKLGIIKVALGTVMLCLCSYITLPLYALVAQMGSRMNKSIFDEQTSKALKKWHNTVKKKQGTVKLGKSTEGAMDGSGSTTTALQYSSSPGPTLHRFNTTGNSTRSSTFEEKIQDEYQSETETETDTEIELSHMSQETNLIVKVDQQAEEDSHHSEGETNNVDHGFTFLKPEGSVERTTT